MRSNCGVLVTFVLFCIGASFVASQQPLTVNGAGASFPAEVYKSWASSFVAERPDLQIIYNSTGSGNGLRTITEGTLPFSASDAVPSDSSYDQVPDLQILPILAGAIVAFTKSFENLTFSRELLANVFIGEVQYWDDDAIKQLNPFTDFPHMRIKIIYRSDSSGTTDAFTSSLSKFSTEWRTRYGASLTWPSELISQSDIYFGASGNEGVFTLAGVIPFSISYVSYSFVYKSLSNQYYIRLINKAGNIVTATADSVTAATRDVEFDDKFSADITDSSQVDAWPCSTFTYVLIRRSSTNTSLCDQYWASIDFISYSIKYYAPKLLISLNGLAPSSDSVHDAILDILTSTTCNGTSRYNRNNPPIPAPAPVDYYYIPDNQISFTPFSTASYSPFYNDVGSTIPASQADTYSLPAISSLFSTNVVFEKYYYSTNAKDGDNGNDRSASSVLSIHPLFTFTCSLISLLACLKMQRGYVWLFTIGLLFTVFAVNVQSEKIELKVMGLYPFTGYLSIYGASEEAATRVAVSDLNESDLLKDSEYMISFQSYDSSSRADSSLQSLINGRNEFNMYGLIGCHDDSASASVAQLSTLYMYPQVSYGSRANYLTESEGQYNFFSRVIPPYKSEGICISSLINEYGWDNIGIIYSGDDYGIATTDELVKNLHENAKVTSVQYSPGTSTLDSPMNVLRTSLVRIIVMLPSNVDDSRTILLEAERYHLIGDNFVWFSGSFASDSTVFYNTTSMKSNSLIKSLAKGMISLKLKGGFGEKYERFLDKWERLNVEEYSGSGKRSIPLYAPYAYDSLELFLRAFITSPYQSIPQFIQSIGNSTFTGLTGPVNMNSTRDRLGIFDIVNLRDTEEGDRGWVKIGDWYEENKANEKYGLNITLKSRFHSGSTEIPDVEVRNKVDYWSCSDREFKTDETGKIKLDHPGPDAENIAEFYECDNFIDCYNFSDESNCSSSYLALFIVFGIITGALILLTLLMFPFVFIFSYIHKRIRVRSASPPFLFIMLTSIIIGYSSIFAWFGQPSSVACGFQPWLLGIGVVSMVSSLAAKNVRIWRIFRNPLKRQAIGDKQVLLTWFILVIPGIFLLFLWTLISTPTATRKEVYSEQHYVCDTGGFTGPPGGMVFFFIFVAYTGIILLFAAIVSFATRKVPSLFNESRLIAFSIYNILFLSLIIIPVFFVLQQFNPFVGWIIRTLAILYAFTTTLFLMFLPKIFGILKDGVGNDPNRKKITDVDGSTSKSENSLVTGLSNDLL